MPLADGETTDEDDIPVNTTKSPRALLRQPSWSMDFPDTPIPGRRSRRIESPGNNTNSRPPRLGSWTVNPGKALGQSDENHNIVILEPKKPAVLDEDSSFCGTKTGTTLLVTGRLVALAPTPKPIVDIPVFEHDQLEMPDPVLCTGTNAAMEGLMEDIIGEEGVPTPSRPAPSTFVPATDVFDEIDFAVANSDHESTDIDIMDYMIFSEDSEDEVERENEQASRDISEPMQGVEQPTEILAPLMTPTPSQSQTSPSSMSGPLPDYHSSMLGGFRRGVTKSKAPTSLRRPHSGLALTRPATRGSNRHASMGTAKFEKKRKMSDTLASSSKRPNLRTKVKSPY